MYAFLKSEILALHLYHFLAHLIDLPLVPFNLLLHFLLLILVHLHHHDHLVVLL